MINKFIKVDKHLFRGSAPSINDVVMLHNDLDINKIVSLDKNSALKINRACKILGINHIILPIEMGKKMSLVKFLENDISELLSNKNGNTFVHCAMGRDRTGLAIALYRCEVQNIPCKLAIREAKKLGFGIGIDPNTIHQYIKIIQDSCNYNDHKKHQDVNDAYDIVSNERDDPMQGATDYASSQLSWSPFEDYRIREFPFSEVYDDVEEQYPTRQDYGLEEPQWKAKNIKVPQNGQYNSSTDAMIGMGPSMIGSGTVI